MKILKLFVRWCGFVLIAIGAFTVLWAASVVIRYQTGWGLTALQRCCDDSWGPVALAGFVSGMFFVLAGAAGVLISKMRLFGPRETPSTRPPRWTMPLAILLFACGIASIALATVFAGMADEFGEATVGIVSYCMLIGVGLLFSGWGLKRARDADHQVDQNSTP